MMRKVFYRLIPLLMTLMVGLTWTAYYREHQFREGSVFYRETKLRIDLYVLRHAIHEYAINKGELPQSLRDLENAGYLGNVPDDPIVHRQRWQIVVGSNLYSAYSQPGIVDVHSTSTELSAEDSPFREW